MLRAARSSSGFSLIEVLAALFILGVAAVTVLGVFSNSLRSIKKSERHTMATIHARSLLDEALAINDITDAPDEFDLGGGMSVRREVELISSDHDLMLYAVTVTVQWPPAGHVTLSGKRVVVEHD